MVKFYAFRKQKKWVVQWKASTGNVISQSFFTEQEAKAFEQSLVLISQKEQAILKRRKKKLQPQGKITVTDLLEQYLESLANTTTRKQNRYHVTHIIRAFGQRQAVRLTPDDAITFLAAQQAKGVSRATAMRRLSILRAALNWGVVMHLIQTSPLQGLKISREESARLDPPTKAEARAIFAVAAPHIQRVIVIGLYTGARIGPSELFQLRWTDIDMDGGVIWMPCAKKNRRRDAKREIPISSHIIPILNQWRLNDNTEYVIHYGGKPVKNISRAWHGALKRAGIKRRIRPYDLRHAFASNILAEQADYKSVAEIMWHDVGILLRTYQHIDRSQKRKAIEKMPNILNLSKK